MDNTINKPTMTIYEELFLSKTPEWINDSDGDCQACNCPQCFTQNPHQYVSIILGDTNGSVTPYNLLIKKVKRVMVLLCESCIRKLINPLEDLIDCLTREPITAVEDLRGYDILFAGYNSLDEFETKGTVRGSVGSLIASENQARMICFIKNPEWKLLEKYSFGGVTHNTLALHPPRDVEKKEEKFIKFMEEFCKEAPDWAGNSKAGT